jgi:hypothetical protein
MVMFPPLQLCLLFHLVIQFHLFLNKSWWNTCVVHIFYHLKVILLLGCNTTTHSTCVIYLVKKARSKLKYNEILTHINIPTSTKLLELDTNIYVIIGRRNLRKPRDVVEVRIRWQFILIIVAMLFIVVD